MLFEIQGSQISEKKKPNICDLDEGFFKGNMFKNLYDPYKNYKPTAFVGSDEQSEMLLTIYKLDFALNDLNLYLSLHPEDEEVYQIFAEYAKKYNKYLEEYERKYQILNLCHDIYGKYTYGDNPWPWEDENV